MKRREFIKTGLAAGAAVGLAPALQSWIPSHNWEGYDFGGGPKVQDRLFQGPFSQYEPEAFYGGGVIQYTTPGKQLVNCFGMGMTSYISGDLGAPIVEGKTLDETIDGLFAFPLATKAYIRPNWKHVQKVAGKLEFDDYWKITMEKADKYNKAVGFRIMMNAPDIMDNTLPDFIHNKIKFTKLPGEWKGNPSQVRYQKEHPQPDYSDPYFLECFEELHALLSEQLNDNPLIEYMDTNMYGLWGEGHSWPFEGNPYKDRVEAEETFMKMFEIQQKYWTKKPLLTNTQPDFSRVGNSTLVDATIRSGNWLRTDTIFIENEQIEALSNRPDWIAAAVEQSLSNGKEETMNYDNAGIPRNEAIISHVKDVGANYFSLWNIHQINPDSLHRYYDKYPEGLDDLSHSIGFRVRPSWIWSNESDGRENLVFGMVNDGIACVPGVLRLTLFSEDGKVNVSGCLDAGFPKTRGVRQAMMTLPAGVSFRTTELHLKAELEYKGVRHPVPFTIAQKLNPDGSLTIKQNVKG